MKETMIVSAFPGAGKSYLFNNYDGEILDSDSSQYSWIKEGVRNPKFPQNYINHIRENIGKVDLIMVSSHKEVRDALFRNGLYFTLCYPDISLKSEYKQRYIERGSPDSFVELLMSKWDEWLVDTAQQQNCTHIVMEKDKFLSDYLLKK